jgi:hypothetical protein
MSVTFVPFQQAHVSQVSAFNARMLQAHAASDFLLPTEPSKRNFGPDDPIKWTQYLAMHEAEVRGGLIAVDQPGYVNGRFVRAFNFQSPLSEGIANPKYALVAMHMIKFMQKQSDAGFCVGMGSKDNPLPRLLAASGWTVSSLPFLFRVHRSGTFFKQLRALRTTPLRRFAALAARLSGVGVIGLQIAQRRRTATNASIRQVSNWGDWADEIWDRYRHRCSFAVLRDRRTLESLYPASNPQMRLFLIERAGKPVGWSACLLAKLSNHRQFGNLNLGSILDTIADADAMNSTAILTDEQLAKLGADLSILNHSHTEWVKAFRSAGFLSGPSNYLLATTKSLTQLVRSTSNGEKKMHVTRGDGDGRIHLS